MWGDRAEYRNLSFCHVSVIYGISDGSAGGPPWLPVPGVLDSKRNIQIDLLTDVRCPFSFLCGETVRGAGMTGSVLSALKCRVAFNSEQRTQAPRAFDPRFISQTNLEAAVRNLGMHLDLRLF